MDFNPRRQIRTLAGLDGADPEGVKLDEAQFDKDDATGVDCPLPPSSV